MAFSKKGIVKLSIASTEANFLGELRRAFPLQRWTRDDSSTMALMATRQLAEYFQLRRRSFDLPLEVRGTPFQQRVWKALRRIPYGETRSYGQIARQVGSARAARAVGMANHANPAAILIPCHRVIAASGDLGGYACGVRFKRRLLDLEAANIR